MRNIIKEIAIFNEDGDKRNIILKDGLNIITGDSKTGKSALIEIVDYCLFSSRSSIPKGKITEFAYLYVVIFQVDSFYIVVGRHAFGNSNHNSAYLKVETSFERIDNIKFEYFSELSLKPIKNNVQTDFEELIGLSFNQLEQEYEKTSKLSIRDTVSFLFQHQNLIANKHALFYRFDDINKRNRVIKAMPVLLGCVDAEYYDLIKQKEVISRKIFHEKKIIENFDIKDEDDTKRLRDSIQLYYSHIGETLAEGLSKPKLISIGQNLPFPPTIIPDQTKAFDKIVQLEDEKEKLVEEKLEIERSLSNLLSNNSDGYEYADILVNTYSKQKYNNANIKQICCPLCNNLVDELNNNITQLESAKENLIDELSKISSFSKDNSRIITRLKERKTEIDYKIRSITRNINELSKNTEEYEKIKSKRDQIVYMKGVITTTINSIGQNNIHEYDKLLEGLKKQLGDIEIALKKYSYINTFKEATEKTLKGIMDRIAEKLDFEEELKPIDFYFDIDKFIFKHKHKGDEIRLDEMGSGANWLACHLSIMLSFLQLSCENEKSVIPTFLMLDQPSQVYFPRTTIKGNMDNEELEKYDDNIQQVRKIFKVLDSEIELISKSCGFKPQIIVLEHANDSDFEKFIIKEWDKSKGQGLI